MDFKTQAANLAWKESFATLSELQTAYPSGDTFNHVVLSDGMIYTWANAQWTNTKVQANGTGIAPKSVTPESTTFFGKSRNLFDGEFLSAVFTWANSTGGPDKLFLTGNGYLNHEGTVIIFPIESNETYTIKIHDAHNMFRLGINDEYPTIPPNTTTKYHITKKVVDNAALSLHTFTNTATGQYGILYVSSTGQKPRVQIEKGSEATPYIEPYAVLSRYTGIDEISQEVSKTSEAVAEVRSSVNSKTATAIEHPVTGYPARPDGVSVIWIGPNEPTGAEVFDEWRQTEGFTNFTDFEEYGVGESPVDWLQPYSSSAVHAVITESDKVLSVKGSANTPYATLWQGVSDSLNTEIYFTGKMSMRPSGTALSSVHRGIGAGGSEGFYIVGIYGVGGSNLRISRKKTDGTAVVLGNKLTDIDVLQPYHQVSRIDGNRVRAKIWQKGTQEPKDWTLDVVDNAPMEIAGGVGVYTFMRDQANTIYEFGVGTNGMRAPRRKVF